MRFIPDPERFPAQGQPNADRSNFWGFTAACLQRMVEEVGFVVRRSHVGDDRVLLDAWRAVSNPKALRSSRAYGVQPRIRHRRESRRPERVEDVLASVPYSFSSTGRPSKTTLSRALLPCHAHVDVTPDRRQHPRAGREPQREAAGRVAPRHGDAHPLPSPMVERLPVVFVQGERAVGARDTRRSTADPRPVPRRTA